MPVCEHPNWKRVFLSMHAHGKRSGCATPRIPGHSAPADSEPFLNAFEFTEFQRLISRFTTRHRRPWEKYSRSLSITNSLTRYGDGIFRTRCQTDGPGNQLVHPFAQDSLDACRTPGSVLGARQEWWRRQTWLLPAGCCRPGRETPRLVRSSILVPTRWAGTVL